MHAEWVLAVIVLGTSFFAFLAYCLSGTHARQTRTQEARSKARFYIYMKIEDANRLDCPGISLEVELVDGGEASVIARPDTFTLELRLVQPVRSDNPGLHVKICKLLFGVAGRAAVSVLGSGIIKAIVDRIRHGL